MSGRGDRGPIEPSPDHGRVLGLLGRPGAVLEVPIEGVSMAPTLPLGSVIRLIFAPLETVEAGSVVAFLAGGTTLTVHRLVSARPGASFMLTRGDGNIFCDPPVPASDLVGRVEAWHDGDGKWAAVPPPREKTSTLTVVNQAAMSSALAIHVRLAQVVALMSLVLMLPFSVARYGVRSTTPEVLRMFKLRRAGTDP